MTQIADWMAAYAWHVGVTVGAVLSLWALIVVIWDDVAGYDDIEGGRT